MCCFPEWPVASTPARSRIARLLKDAGYATQMVGKWHCGDQAEFLPTRHGFDGWYGLPYSNDMGIQASKFTEEEIKKITEELGINLPFVKYPPLPLMLDEEVVEAQPDQAALTERYLQESIRFMRSNRDQPFFLYFAHMYVHLPLYVQQRFLAESRNGPYGAAVRCIDWALAVLMAELSALGLSDDTIVIFTSDNGALCRPGEGSNAPLRDVKGTTWEGGIRVPCIVRWPGRIPAGSTTDALTTAMDLYPTIAGWCGADLPTDRTIDGRDLDALLRSEAVESPRETFLYYSGATLEAVRLGTWKLHLAKDNKWRGGETEEMPQLFDLAADVGETNNVLADNPDVVAEIMVHVEAARSELGDVATGTVGTGRRKQGRVDNPVTLTTFDPDHPYYMAEYDLADRG